MAEGLHDHPRGDALLERLYCDVLGRPMRGSAEITGQERAAHRFTAALTTGDGARVHETETVKLSAH